MDSLRVLWLDENPINTTLDPKMFRLKVIEALPQLYKLNNTNITIAEREEASQVKFDEDPVINNIENNSSQDNNLKSNGEYGNTSMLNTINSDLSGHGNPLYTDVMTESLRMDYEGNQNLNSLQNNDVNFACLDDLKDTRMQNNNVNFACMDDLRDTRKSETVGMSLGSMARYADTNLGSAFKKSPDRTQANSGFFNNNIKNNSLIVDYSDKVNKSDIYADYENNKYSQDNKKNFYGGQDSNNATIENKSMLPEMNITQKDVELLEMLKMPRKKLQAVLMLVDELDIQELAC